MVYAFLLILFQRQQQICLPQNFNLRLESWKKIIIIKKNSFSIVVHCKTVFFFFFHKMLFSSIFGFPHIVKKYCSQILFSDFPSENIYSIIDYNMLINWFFFSFFYQINDYSHSCKIYQGTLSKFPMSRVTGPTYKLQPSRPECFFLHCTPFNLFGLWGTATQLSGSTVHATSIDTVRQKHLRGV